MTSLTREVWIDAPVNEVWAKLADFGRIYVFNPSVPQSHSTSAQSNGVGATRHCDLGSGSSIEERIVEWKDGQSMKIEIYEGKNAPPFKNAFATLSVRPERGGTQVSGTLEYTLKFGPVGALMDAMMVRSQFSKAWSGLFAGLKHHIETGETVESLSAIDVQPVLAVA